jgi:ketosteroid isomerase-like protein
MKLWRRRSRKEAREMGANERALRGYLEAIDAHDLKGVRASFTGDAGIVAPGVELHGKEEIVGWIRVFITAFPDLKHEVRAVIETGDACVAEVRFSGTHTGPLASPDGEILPTGKPFVLDYAHISRFEDGRIKSDHVYFDQLTFLSQLGLLPAPTA